MKSLVFSLCLLLATGCGGSGSNAAPETPANGPAGDAANYNGKKGPSLTSCYKGDTWTCAVEDAIVKETNLLRSKPLTQSFESSYVVRLWSDSQARSGQISHDGFPAERRKALIAEFPDAAWNFFAENVGMLQSLETNPDAAAIAKKFVANWNGSPGHRENMLGNYTYIGVGVSRNGRSFYATQIFH